MGAAWTLLGQLSYLLCAGGALALGEIGRAHV